MSEEQIEAIFQHACEGAAESIGHTREDWQRVVYAIRELRARLAAAESERDRIKSLIANAPTVLTKYQIGDAIYDSPPMSRNMVKLELIPRPARWSKQEGV